MRSQVRGIGFTITRITLAVALLSAGGLKAHQLSTGVPLGIGFWNSRAIMISVVLFELGFGLWLLSGLHPNASRFLAFVLFFAFLQLSLVQALNGQPSCGCLGQVLANPWYLAVFDFVVLLLLLLCAPFAGNVPTISSRPLVFFLFTACFLCTGIPLLYQMRNYNSSGVPSILRFDPDLRFPAGLDLQGPTTQDILRKLEEASGLRIAADSSFLKNQPDYGSLELRKASGWMVMEMLVQKQLLPSRWDKIAGGYYLSRAAGTTAWLISGIALGAFVSFLTLVKTRAILSTTAVQTQERQAKLRQGYSSTIPRPTVHK